MRRLHKIMVVAAGVSVMTTTVSFAQWPTSPAAPLIVADSSGSQVQPKMVARQDGGFYVSWFDNRTGGYDVYLQRLDVEGRELWPHTGVLVADRSFSSTQDYGLGVDTEGNALLAFRDDRNLPVEITASKVGRDGTLLWGAGGVQVSSGGAFVAAPKVTGSSDGNVVVAWTSDTNVMIQKLDPSGTPLWGAGLTYVPAVGSFAVSDLHASNAGTAIVSFNHTTGNFGSPIHIWAQKLAAVDGASLWGAGHVQVFDGGSLQFGNFPQFISDELGGAVFAWYTNSPSLQCRVQRILTNGTEAFAHQGLEVSTNAAQIRVGPAAAFNQITQEIFVAWREQNSVQSQSALFAQKFDAGGIREWTDSGRQLMPMSGDEIREISTKAVGEGALVTWIQTPSFGNDPVYSIRVDGNGDFAWSPPIAEVCILPTGSDDLVGVRSREGFAAYTWSDGGTSSGDIYAANLNDDGSLGNLVSVFRDDFESGTVDEWTNVIP
jgi:hypothetical protein